MLIVCSALRHRQLASRVISPLAASLPTLQCVHSRVSDIVTCRMRRLYGSKAPTRYMAQPYKCGMWHGSLSSAASAAVAGGLTCHSHVTCGRYQHTLSTCCHCCYLCRCTRTWHMVAINCCYCCRCRWFDMSLACVMWSLSTCCCCCFAGGLTCQRWAQ